MVGYQQDRRRRATFAGSRSDSRRHAADDSRSSPGLSTVCPHALQDRPSPCHGTCGALAARVPQGNCCFPMQAKSAEWPPLRRPRRPQCQGPEMKKAGLATFLGLVLLAPAHAEDDAAQFFKGKTVRIIVGVGVGSGYDLNARLLARHLPDHIPGHPAVVVQNQPGAGSLTMRSEEHTSELQSLRHLVCRLLLEKKKTPSRNPIPPNAPHRTPSRHALR